MEEYKKIVGHEKVTEHFGYWPSFHDTEVLTMNFNRDHIFEEPGPSLTARIHVFETTSEKDEEGHLITTKHCIITLDFDNLEKLEFNGFNHQNAIYGLHFASGKDINNKPIIKVEFEPAFGMDCKFECREAVVINIEKGLPRNSVYT